MARYHSEGSHYLWIGAALGGLAVGAATLFLNSKKSKKILDNAIETYDDYKEKATCAANHAIHKTKSVWEKSIKVLIDLFNKAMAFMHTSKNQTPSRKLLIGGALSALAAGAAIILIRRTTAQEEGIIDRISKKAEYWKNQVTSIIDAFDEDYEHKNGTHPNNKSIIEDVMELATTGIEFWQKMKSR